MTASSRPTLAEIARAARVSKSTVSRALRGHAALPEATIARIRRHAGRLGYDRSPLVAEVMRRVRHRGPFTALGQVAYLTFEASAQGWREHLTYVRFFEGAQARAVQLGLHLEPFWINEPGLTPARAASILRARGIEGVLIGPASGWVHTPQLDLADFCAVKIGTPFADLPLPCAGHHHFRGMMAALDELAARGYARPGLVLPAYLEAKTGGAWSAALLHRQAAVRARDRVPPLYLTEVQPAALTAWLKKHSPDVVLGVGSALLPRLAALGRRVPRDIGFVDLDRCTADRAGIDQRSDAIGGAAVDLLLSRMLAQERGPPAAAPLVLIEGGWVEGPTVRPRPVRP